MPQIPLLPLDEVPLWFAQRVGLHNPEERIMIKAGPDVVEYFRKHPESYDQLKPNGPLFVFEVDKTPKRWTIDGTPVQAIEKFGQVETLTPEWLNAPLEGIPAYRLNNLHYLGFVTIERAELTKQDPPQQQAA